MPVLTVITVYRTLTVLDAMAVLGAEINSRFACTVCVECSGAFKNCRGSG